MAVLCSSLFFARTFRPTASSSSALTTDIGGGEFRLDPLADEPPALLSLSPPVSSTAPEYAFTHSAAWARPHTCWIAARRTSTHGSSRVLTSVSLTSAQRSACLCCVMRKLTRDFTMIWRMFSSASEQNQGGSLEICQC